MISPPRSAPDARQTVAWCIGLTLALSMIGGCGERDVSPGQAPTPLPSPIPMPSLPQYRLDGYVYDRTTRRPISANVDVQTATGESLVRTTTDADGHYVAGPLSRGMYLMHFTAAGYDPRTHTIELGTNSTVDITLSRSGVVTLMLAFAAEGTFRCLPNGTPATNVSIANTLDSSIQVTFAGATSHTFALAPRGTHTFRVEPGPYQSSGQSPDGGLALETAGWTLSGGCDYPLELCVANNNRRCTGSRSVAGRRQDGRKHDHHAHSRLIAEGW